MRYEVLGSIPGKSMEHKPGYMELTSTQLLALNAKLPAFYTIIQLPSKESRPPQRKSEAENLDFEVQFQPKPAEVRPARMKRQMSYDSADPQIKQSDSFKRIHKILQTVQKHPMAEPFLQPVDPKLVPDYYTVVQEPMDLSTVEKKLKNGDYESGYQFAMDMRLIWSNSFYYNAKGSDLYHITMELSSLFEKLMKGNESIMLADKNDVVQDLYRKLEKLTKGIKEIQNNKAPVSQVKVQIKPQVEKTMTLQEKKVLCNNIKKLDPKYLRGVLDIVQECMDIQGEELEFDIDKLPSRVCRELEKYVKQCLQNASRSQKKKTPNVNIEGIKTAQEMTSTRLKDLDSQLDKLAHQGKEEQPQEVAEEDSSESESSSTSESESEEDNLPMPSQDIGNYQDLQNPMWNMFQGNADFHDFTSPGFGMDFDKQQDIFR